MGRRRDGIARARSPDRCRDGVLDAARRLARTCLGDGRGLRDGRRVGLGGHGDGVVPPAQRPHRDPRPQPARTTRPHHARMERRRVPRSSAGVRVARDRDRRSRRRRDRRRVHAGEEHRSPDDDRRTHGERPRSVPRGQRRGMARQGALRGAGRRGDRGAGRRAAPDDHPAEARVVRADRTGRPPHHGAARLRRSDRDAQGVRRLARLARRSPSGRRGARRRGRELHV